MIIDELKINCLKFISLNIVSYLEATYLERLLSLPVYLLRDLENFIKIHNAPEKYLAFDMKAVEDIEGSTCFEGSPEHRKLMDQEEHLTADYCSTFYNELIDLFEDYHRNLRLQDSLRTEICTKALKFRA